MKFRLEKTKNYRQQGEDLASRVSQREKDLRLIVVTMRAIIEPKDQPRLIHRSTKRSGSHPSSKKREPECCFYKNPTLLSRLILHQKYAEALRRCQQHPDEAAVWLCVKRLQEPPTLDATATGDHRTGNEVYSMRQLPLHMACQDLSRVGVEAGNRNQLEELICHLVLANPPGCSRQDHSGRWALHEAVWCAAKPDTISALLCAAPEIANSNDQYGRSTIYLNHHCRVRTPDAQARVQEMLLRGTEFWEMARQVSIARPFPEQKQPFLYHLLTHPFCRISQLATHCTGGKSAFETPHCSIRRRKYRFIERARQRDAKRGIG